MARTTKDWPWSSYRATAGLVKPWDLLNIDWILSAFSRHKSIATQKYLTFVAEGKNQPSPWEQLTNQIYLGVEAFGLGAESDARTTQLRSGCQLAEQA